MPTYDTDDAYNRFLAVISPLVEEYVPTSTHMCHARKVPWKVNPPTSLLTQRKAAWDKYKATRSRLGRTSTPARDALDNFFVINCNVKNFAIASQSRYELQMLEDFKRNPKQLHAYIRHKKVGCPTAGPLELGDGRLTDNALLMAETLATAFESVYVDSDQASQAAEHQSAASRMPPLDLTFEDVFHTLQSLDHSSAAGIDN